MMHTGAKLETTSEGAQAGDEPEGRFCGALDLEPGIMCDQQAQTGGQNSKAGGCGHLDPVQTVHASLQVSRAMVYEGTGQGGSSSEGTSSVRAGPLSYATVDAMSVVENNNHTSWHPNLTGKLRKNTSLHPFIGRWDPRKACCMPLHPSVGSFKRKAVNLFDFERAAFPSWFKIEAREGWPVSRQQRYCRAGAEASMQY